MPPHITPSNSNPQIPVHQLLLSISGDSKISLQHTSVQQLSAIPEDHELIEDYEGQDEQIATEDDMEEPRIIISDPAPDGGYGWVIVLSSFLCNLIVDGIGYTFGLFFEEFVRHFNTTKGKVALCGSLLSGCYLGAGPLVSALANQYGCRFVTILGSIIAFFALLLSTIAPNIEVLMFTYGIMGGIGFGLIFLPAIVSVGYYFTTKRAFATGIAVCGSGIGAFLFAPFCQYLLGIMDWKNAFIILAALALNCAVFGALMRPLNVHAEAVVVDESNNRTSSRKPLLQRIAEEKRRRLLSHSNSQFLLLMQNGSDANDEIYDELKSRLMMNTEPGVHSTLNLDQLFSQPTQQQLSPIIEKKFNYSESSSPQSSAPGSPTNEIKDSEMQLQDSAISLSGELTFPSTTTIAPQSPSSENTNKLSGSVQTIGPTRRRTPALRTVSESSNSAVPPPLQVILSSGTPSHSRRSSLNKSQAIYVRPMYKKDIFYSGSTLQLPQNSSLQQMAESQGVISANMGQSVVSIPARDIINKVQQQLALMETDGKDAIEQTHQNCCSKLVSFLSIRDKKQDSNEGEFNAEKSNCMKFTIPPSMKNILKEMLDFSLIRDSGAFTLLVVANVFGMMGFYVPFVYITQYALSSVKDGDNLINSESAALLISVIGITNTFGRLLFGLISDRINRNGTIVGLRLTALAINNYCLFFCGLTVIGIPFCRTYNTVLFDCILFGLFVSAYVCLTSIILVDMLGLERLTNAFGVLSLFRGASSMVGPPLAGILFDITDSYYIVFATAGTLLIISSLISFLIPNRDVNEKEDQELEYNV